MASHSLTTAKAGPHLHTRPRALQEHGTPATCHARARTLPASTHTHGAAEPQHRPRARTRTMWVVAPGSYSTLHSAPSDSASSHSGCEEGEGKAWGQQWLKHTWQPWGHARGGGAALTESHSAGKRSCMRVCSAHLTQRAIGP